MLTTTQAPGTSSIFAGKITNGNATSMGLTQAGSGTLILSGANTYSGSTTVTGGVLEAATATTLPTNTLAGSLSVSSGATLAVATSSWTSGNIDSLLTHTSAFNSGAIIGFDTTGASNFTYSTVIGDGTHGPAGMGLNKIGANMLTLGGATPTPAARPSAAARCSWSTPPPWVAPAAA